MRGARLYLILCIVVIVALILVFGRACRSGNHPQSLDDDTERTTVSALALPDVTAA